MKMSGRKRQRTRNETENIIKLMASLEVDICKDYERENDKKIAKMRKAELKKYGL